ncbi:Scr1 family TA system antitoxin-like transcriptional regulator [Pseudonocardia sp. HH130630-07]|uniref:Scr1 family TA system antitoxin-like transcriptional regulator n=1 Tax=Pseudonocardia sp. HH130630-07 TaxID=1690815 RepID=UPI001E4D5DA6|nr:Scr1 family TA system antitoxin-like transcriptional regulator [Pseudonocardia sp. HH130630-07]
MASWELSLRLRERRIELGVDVATITGALGFTRNYWSAVENERRILSEEKLGLLIDLLEFDTHEQGELYALREQSRGRGWWTAYSALYGEETHRFHGLEYGAQSIRSYEGLVPGLLQTPEYTRALMEASIHLRPVEVDQRIEVRRRRQERLTGEDPLHLTVILGEAALLQQVGGREVFRAQLQYLAEMARAHPKTIQIRVLTFNSPGCSLIGASTFHLIDFASSRLPTLVWQEAITVRQILDQPGQVRDVVFAWADALRLTLSAEESVRMVEGYAEEL